MDTAVCTGSASIVNFSCGFINADPNLAVPRWRIIRRNADGSVMSDMTFEAIDINTNTNDGLEWVPDLTSGSNNAPNGRLVVGPVNETYNQSSYQCSFVLGGGTTTIVSSIGTLTVTGMSIHVTLSHLRSKGVSVV